MLSGMAGGSITSTTFYLQQSADAAWTATFAVTITEVDATTLFDILDFWGIATNENTDYVKASISNAFKFLPKTTFAYEPAPIVGPEVTLSDDGTEASFDMPGSDVTVDYELVATWPWRCPSPWATARTATASD